MESELVLDLSYEEKRALHRIVRAMHDGECPKCHGLYPSMRQENGDEVCPNCKFTITKEEVDAAMMEFAEIMERNLEVFEGWRKKRKTKS